MIDHIMTSTQFVKGRVKNGHVKNGHNLKNFKKICSDIDMDEYVAVGIHEAQPTSNTKINDLAHSLLSKKQKLYNKIEKSEAKSSQIQQYFNRSDFINPNKYNNCLEYLRC